jgi:hypothetical protein
LKTEESSYYLPTLYILSFVSYVTFYLSIDQARAAKYAYSQASSIIIKRELVRKAESQAFLPTESEFAFIRK